MDDYSLRFLEESCLISTTDATGKLTYVNDFFCRTTGYHKDELIGTSYRALQSDQHPGEFFDGLWKQIGDGKSWRGYICSKTKNGELIWLDTHIFPKSSSGTAPAGFASYQIPLAPPGYASQAAGPGDDVALYHSLVDNLPLSIWRKDSEGRITFVNKTLVEKLKVPAASLLGKTNYDLYPKYLADKFKADDEEVIKEGVMYHNVEESVNIVTGERMFVETIKIPIRGRDGVIEGLQGVFWDITEAVEASKRLAKTESYHKKLIDRINEIIWLVNSDGKIIYSSESVKKIIGYPVEEVVTGMLLEFVEPADRPAAQRALAEVSVANTKEVRFNLRIVSKNDTRLWVETIIANYAEDPDIGAFIVNMRNIDDEKKAEESIRYQANLLEQVSDAIISTDENFRIITWNKAAEKIYGWKASEMIGRLVTEALATRYLDADSDAVMRDFLANSMWEGEVVQKNKKGQDIQIFASVSLMRDDTGRHAGSIAVNRNITDSKEAERKLRQQNEQLTEIAWLHSHKIRGPVATIMGLMNIFDWHNLSAPENLDIVKKVDQVSKQLDAIIHDVVKKTGELYDE